MPSRCALRAIAQILDPNRRICLDHRNIETHTCIVFKGPSMNVSIRTNVSMAAIFILALSLLVSACTSVRLISDYDEATDKALTALQRSTDDFITKLIANANTENNAFEIHEAYYNELDQELRSLEFRVSSIPQNSKTEKLISNIRASILGDGKCTKSGISLRDLHCLPNSSSMGPSKEALAISQQSINSTIRAALALELAKKHGLE